MKPLEWIGSTYDDLSELPPDVQSVMGYGLYLAQTGSKHHRENYDNQQN